MEVVSSEPSILSKIPSVWMAELAEVSSSYGWSADSTDDRRQTYSIGFVAVKDEDGFPGVRTVVTEGC